MTAAVPLYPTGTRITTPLGSGTVRSFRNSRHQSGVRLVEVQLDRESCIRTWTEGELALAGNIAHLRTAPPRFTPGEAVSTLAGEGVIRNLMRDLAGVPHALVQLIGTNRSIEVPCAELSPPLEAA